ncbi:hypothetical protein [Halorussus halophilus]|uniref:hypothetical protein n=1 Tax=Halorussus halophilus TaxID=2650975 RepID=UPI0013012968|nr:hypothetical protein [Halorussus halophilus]
MGKNIAYLGVSSPLAYDYGRETDTKPPNPVLEAPLGLFLLYDELWFLHPCLCPENMQELEYVRFLSDRHDITDYYESVEQLDEDEILGEEPPSVSRRPWKQYGELVKHVAPFAKYDNHGRLFDSHFYPDASYGNFLIDQFIASELNTDVDYIANSAVMQILDPNPDVQSGHPKRLSTAEELVSRRIATDLPNLQSPRGPYFEAVDDFRNIDSIGRFREKLDSSPEELDADSLDNEFREVRNRVFAAETDRSNVYKSVVSLMLIYAPGVGKAANTTSKLNDIVTYDARSRKHGWTNFLANVSLNATGEQRDAPN